MGRCMEFGPKIGEGCDHPMVAGAVACACPECGAACTGKFAGCPAVWAAGPVPIPVRPRQPAPAATPEPAAEPEPPVAQQVNVLLTAIGALRHEVRLLAAKVEALQGPADDAPAVSEDRPPA